jgi:hypothetical protein
MGNSKIVRRLFVHFLFLFISFIPALSKAGSGITYHGKIIKPDGVTPVTSVTTQFRIQVRTPGTESCLLWEEQQTKDLSSSAGVFTLTIADATEPSLIANSLPFSLERVFSNRTGFTGLTGCSLGTSYSPSTAADGRVLQVFFKENPSDPWEQMPVTKVNFIPLALNSVQLEGYAANEFLKIDPLSSYTTLTAANVNTLVDLIAGTNAQYLKPSSAFAGDVTGTSGVTVVEKIRGTNVVATAPTVNQVLKFDGTNWTPGADDTGGSPADSSYSVKGVVQINTDLATSGLFIAGGVLALPNVISAGGPVGAASTVPVITYDQKGRLTAVSTATIDDTTKLPLAGGTMSGSIDMGTHDITNATNLAATNASLRNLILSDNDTNTITVKSPADITANYTLTLPLDKGASGEVITSDGNGVLSWASPASGLALTSNQVVVANGTGSALQSYTCTIGKVLGFDGTGLPTCVDVTGAGGFLNDGNSFGAAATLGTNDNFDLNFETNGTTKMTVLASGNVGVGTAAPTSSLQVSGTAGTVATNVTGTPPSISLRHTSNTNGAWGIYQGNSGTYDELSFMTGGSVTRMTMLFNGNVGIGTTTPNTQLDITGAFSQRGIASPAISVAGQGRIYFDSTSNTFKVSQNNGAYVDLVPSGGSISGLTASYLPKATSATALGDSIIAESSGKIGIGTATPTNIMNIYSNSNGDLGTVSTTNQNAGGLATAGYTAINDAGGSAVFGITSSGFTPVGNLGINTGLLMSSTLAIQATGGTGILSIATGGTAERMRINESGNIGIGTTTPVSILDVSDGNEVGFMLGADPGARTRTNFSSKTGSIVVPHRTNAEEPMSLIFGQTAAQNSVYIGGGSANLNAASEIRLYTASNTTTLAGTERLHITGSGNIGIGLSSPTSLVQTLATGAKTAAYTGHLLSNTATSSTGSIAKIGLDVQSTGTWNGASATNTGLNVTVSGGTNNYAGLFQGGNVGIGTTTPSSTLNVVGSIVSTSVANTVAYINFGAGNVQMSSTAATTINICGLKDGGTYTLVLTGVADASSVTVNAYPTYVNTTSCSGTAMQVDMGTGDTTFISGGNTNIITFVYFSARGANGTVYGIPATNYNF